jgi:hypothetical protein
VRAGVGGDGDADRPGARVVGLVVVGHGVLADRFEPVGAGFVVAQPGAGGDDVEDLHHLGAQRPRELPVAAGGVLSRDLALLVRGWCPEAGRRRCRGASGR